MCLYITGHLDTVFLGEYRNEILRYLYCQQVKNFREEKNTTIFILSKFFMLSNKKWLNVYGDMDDRTKMVAGDFTFPVKVLCSVPR